VAEEGEAEVLPYPSASEEAWSSSYRSTGQEPRYPFPVVAVPRFPSAEAEEEVPGAFERDAVAEPV
jgi:hypothetical protein